MRILSGIQPSGALHIGNYFGMMQPAIDLQKRGEALYFIADYHALTSVEKADDLRRNIPEVALAFLACGLDTAKTIMFRQSDVPAHVELSWLLSCVTPMGLLERAHSYKDKTERGLAASHGLFAYPVLMAADILLYQTDVVPVGKDQKQHLEITRDIAQKFNDKFGPVFKIPEPEIRESVAVIPGIDGQKMSKSYNNTLELFGEEKAFQKQVMSIVTDSTPVEQPKPTEGSTLVALYKLVSTPEELADYEAMMKNGGVGYGDLKKKLHTRLVEYFAPMREKYNQLKKKPDEVEEVLQYGARRARSMAEPTLQAARAAVGLLPEAK
jgi:tryptophanyl-tRNA synthetase